KGQRVIVTGALKVRNYERQDGSKGTSVEMTVDEIGPSLRFATATVTRTSGGSGGGGGGAAANPWGGGGNAAAPAAPAQQGGWDTPSSNDDPPF
ncbi:MAG TPA: single-stranded DNA-binding protein, partial [Aeromicrobium sp.]|nr:single-stranded DNA-binding protein [Aeromicrobium sp.]